METALPSPKGLKKKKQGISKNPYSMRGLDKFSTVLSDLEARKAKIMATAGNQGVSMVRFMYSNSHDWIPVVVKLRDSSQEDATSPSSSKPKIHLALPPPTNWNSEPEGSVDAKTGSEIKDEEKRAKGGWRRWRPSYYWPAVMVLILLCLVMSGRVFAICCTSMWWYLVPVMKGEIATGDCRKSRGPTRKKRKDKEPGDRKR